jgi:hypothetical protein
MNNKIMKKEQSSQSLDSGENQNFQRQAQISKENFIF